MKNNGKYVKVKSPHGKGTVESFIPDELPGRKPLSITPELLSAIAASSSALGKLEGKINNLPDHEIIISQYIKKEAVLSSQIEGTEASLTDILSKENKILKGSATDDEKVTYNYVKAVNYGLSETKKTDFSVDIIKKLHKILLEGTRGEKKQPGELRIKQNYLVNSRNEITFTPPPPDKVPGLMKNMIEYANNYKDPTLNLIKCGILHYQFETIHPFLDGNGRIGRLLIMLFLAKKKELSSPVLYMSYFFKKHKGEYYRRLSEARSKGELENWILFFLRGVEETSTEVSTLSDKIYYLKQRITKDVMESQERASSGMLAVINDLFNYPITSVNRIVSVTGLSYNASKAIVEKLIKLNILKQFNAKERDRQYVFTEYIRILE